MNGRKPGENLTKGFLKRIWDYFSTSFYQKKLNNNKFYDKNWDNLKWKLRFGRMIFFISIYMGSKYFLVENVYTNVKDSVENKKKIFLDKTSELDFNYYSDDKETISKTEYDKNLEKNLIEQLNKLNQGLFNIQEIILENIKIQDKALNIYENKNNSKAAFLKDLTDTEKYSMIEEIYKVVSKKSTFLNQVNDEVSSYKLLFYRVTNLLTKNQMKEETEESIKFIRYYSFTYFFVKVLVWFKIFLKYFSNRYRDLIQDLSVDFRNKIPLSLNIFEFCKNKEELAFFLTSKITAMKFKRETEKEIEKTIKEFLNNVILEDKKPVHYEDYEFLIKDLEKTKNYNEFIILNPYFAKNHNYKYYELIKKLKEFIFTEKCRYIVNVLNMLKESKINLEELREYNMENLKIVNLVIFTNNIFIIFYLIIKFNRQFQMISSKMI